VKSSDSAGTLWLILAGLFGFWLAQTAHDLWSPAAAFLSTQGIAPLPTLGLVLVLAGAAAYAGLKRAVLRTFPAQLHFRPAHPDHYPSLDLEALVRYSYALETLGFGWALDYRLEAEEGHVSPGYARLFIHPRHGCYAEVNQLFPAGAAPTPMRCSLVSLLEDGSSVTDTDRRPGGIAFALRSAREARAIRPGATPAELLEAHLQRREKLCEALETDVAPEPSPDRYFDRQEKLAEERRRSFQRRSLLAWALEAAAFRLRPRDAWTGSALRGALARHRSSPTPTHHSTPNHG
jgi:hypothetical protein